MLPHLYPHTALHREARIDVPTDKGYVGAGAGVRSPFKCGSRMSEGTDPDGATVSQLITSTRAVAERANALQTQRWTALKRITLDPAVVPTVMAAALALIHFEHGK